MSIYLNLYKYRSTASSSPLENFLTEALADLMNRMNKSDSADLILNVLLRYCTTTPINEAKGLASALRDAESLSWKTQRAIKIGSTIKYPDILVTADDRPVLIIEAKLGAGFTRRSETGSDGVGKEVHQLADYGQWLAGQNPDAALVLLTLWSPPPDDFTNTPSNYGVLKRSVAYWPQVYRWLKHLLSHDASSANVCQQLAGELMRFMEAEVGMKEWDRDDLALLSLAMSRNLDRRWGETLSEINSDEYIREILHSKGEHKADRIDMFRSILSYYYWRDKALGWWIGWGLCIPPGPWNLLQNPTLPDCLLAFVVIAPEEKIDIPRGSLAQEMGWLSPESGAGIYFKATNPIQFCGMAAGFVGAFREWLVPKLKEAEQILTDAERTLSELAAR